MDGPEIVHPGMQGAPVTDLGEAQTHPLSHPAREIEGGSRLERDRGAARRGEGPGEDTLAAEETTGMAGPMR